MTRLFVDGRALGDDSAYRGIGTYLRNMLVGLARDEAFTTTVLATEGTPLPPGVQRMPLRRRAPGRFARLEHELLLPLDLSRATADVVHSPAQDPPMRCRPPWVQSLHDVEPLRSGSASERRRWRRNAQRIRRAAAVIAVSEWSARVGTDVLGLDSRLVHVVHHGVDERFHPPERREPPLTPYVLLVGEYDPRKRHELAFAVVAALADKGLPHRLVVAGRIAPWYAGAMRRLVEASPRPDLVELTGYVSEDELLGLYQCASAVLVTSSAEGFGFPALEAMACGTPVVAFANSAVRELLEGAAALVPDADVTAMTAATYRLLTDEAAWQDASAAAVSRAGEFTWAKCVEQHAQIFRAVAG